MLFLIASTGHSWREVEDDWDFPRLERWLAYCAKHPPLQAMVQSYLRIEPADVTRVTTENMQQVVAMLSMDSKTGGSA